MINIRGLRNQMIALAGLIVAAMFWSVLISPLTKRSSWLVNRDSTMDLDTYKAYGSRLAGILREQARETKEKDKRLGILLGSSTLQDGIDPTILTADSTNSMQWFSLFCHGLNMLDLRNVSDLFFKTDLKPDVVILGVTPGMFATEDNYFDVMWEEAGLSQVAKYFLAGNLDLLNKSIKNTTLIAFERMLPNREWINHYARRNMNDFRLEFFHKLGFGVESLFAPLADPYVVPMRIGRGGNLARDRMQILVGRLGSRRWFDKDNYDPKNNRCQAYIDIVKRAKAMGAKVYVVLLPEPKIMRDNVPLNSLASISEPLEREFGKDAPKVLNFRESMDEKYFHDHMHLNHDGRPVFSHMLSEALNKEIKN